MNWRNKITLGQMASAVAGGIAAGVVIMLASAALAGCSTVKPVKTEAAQPSFDSGQQNSGFLGWTNVDQSKVGIITAHAHDRYNSLIAVYGSRFVPPLNLDQGTQQVPGSGNWWIQQQAIVNFETMNRWRKEATP